jgi:uncharacterized membrane protein (UPF0127 family)
MIYFHGPDGRRDDVDVRIQLCDRFLTRFSGAMFQRRICPDEVYWLPGVRSVHTIGMAEPISLIFYGEEGRVLRYEPSVPPYRIRLGPSDTKGVLEFDANRLSNLSIPVNKAKFRVPDDLSKRVQELDLIQGSE